MFRRRERFERTDVPQSTAAGMTLALAAMVFIVVGLLVGWRVATMLSNRDLSLSDKSLGNAIDAQSTPGVPDGYIASTDIFDEALLLTVDDVTSDTPTLTAAEVLSINETTGAAMVAIIPLNMRVESDAGASMLQSMCAGSGPASCVEPFFMATGVKITHVVVSSTDIWAKFDELRGTGERSLVTASPELFATIRTDMTNDELMDLIDRIGTIGTASIARFDAPAGEGTLDDGTGVSLVDATQLRLTLGLIAPIAEPEYAEGEDSGEGESSEGSYDDSSYDEDYYYDDYYDEY